MNANFARGADRDRHSNRTRLLWAQHLGSWRQLVRQRVIPRVGLGYVFLLPGASRRSSRSAFLVAERASSWVCFVSLLQRAPSAQRTQKSAAAGVIRASCPIICGQGLGSGNTSLLWLRVWRRRGSARTQSPAKVSIGSSGSTCAGLRSDATRWSEPWRRRTTTSQSTCRSTSTSPSTTKSPTIAIAEADGSALRGVDQVGVGRSLVLLRQAFRFATIKQLIPFCVRPLGHPHRALVTTAAVATLVR